MEKTKNKILTLLLSVVLAILIGFSVKIPTLISNLAGLDISDTAMDLIKDATRLVSVFLMIFLTKKLLNEKIKFGKENLIKGIFLYGLAVIAIDIFHLIFNYSGIEKSASEIIPSLLCLIITSLCIGLYEEMLCRGLLFNAFKDYFGDSKKGIYLSVFLSSFIFGLFHLMNLIDKPYLIIGTITQVIYAIFGGVLFAVIYYRSGNILPGMILHASFNFTSLMWKCFRIVDTEQIKTEAQDLSVFGAVFILSIYSVMFISAIIQLILVFRKRKFKE